MTETKTTKKIRSARATAVVEIAKARMETALSTVIVLLRNPLDKGPADPALAATLMKQAQTDISATVETLYDEAWDHGWNANDEMNAAEPTAEELAAGLAAGEKRMAEIAEERSRSIQAAMRREYWNDITHVALNVMSGKLMSEAMAAARSSEFERPPKVSVDDLIDSSLIIGRRFVDELARQDPPKHYADKRLAAYRTIAEADGPE